jgi:hypothetical protein
MTDTQAAALLLACSQSRGVGWSLPKRRVLWEGLAEFAQRHLTNEDVALFQRRIEERGAAGRPLVDPERVSAVRWPESSPHAHFAGKYVAGARKFRMARDGDEWLDQQRARASDLAKRAHQRNWKTEHYRALRAAALSAVGHRCERCGAEGQLELHHKHYMTLGVESLGDVEILCRTCHQGETERRWAERRARWRPWGAGRVRSWG